MKYDDILNINKKIKSSIDRYSIGLANGKMGICIYFYHLSRVEKNLEYESFADTILEEIIRNIPPYESIGVQSINVESGLAGIAIGINHLLEEKFIEGNIDEILEDIDDIIFKIISSEKDNLQFIEPNRIIKIIYYLYIRYIKQKDENGKYIFSELIIKSIESLYQKITPSFFDETISFSTNFNLPIFLFVISRIMSLNIYNYRINKILFEYKIKILSTFPLSHANRLFLLFGMVSIKSYINSIELNKQIELLKENIDLNLILSEELKNMQLFLSNGISLVYFLLSYLQKKHPESAIKFDPVIICNRIICSELWKKIEDDNYSYGMLDGISGALLTLSYIKTDNNL